LKRLLFLVAAVAALLAPASALAHPLGNFTVNRHAEISLSGGRIYVHYALDLAEIPTLQLGQVVRRTGFAARAAKRLELRVDGRSAPLRVREHRTVRRPGAGGLETLRFDAVYETRVAGSSLSFRDRNFGSRIGWREIVVHAGEGAELESASVPAESESDELRAYPSDLHRSPLDVSAATARFTLGSGAGVAPRLDGVVAAEHEGGGFEALIDRGELSLGVVLLSLLIAAFWGAAHALTPGHGKAIVAGYLVGTKGRPLDAVLLGGVVTLTHTAGVFALGFVTLLLSQFIVPETLYPWLTLTSGLLVVAVGASVLRNRFRGREHGHDHGHAHDHGHDHHHHHHHEVDRRGIIGVGLAAGLLPCPSALVVLLSAIALHRIGFGLALIVAFSLGLAATITAIGLVAVLAKRAFGRMSLNGPVIRLLPSASALVILVVGLVLTVKALPEVL
jgi:ABC-type nickel/cobalt efflux system permease component RcnA